MQPYLASAHPKSPVATKTPSANSNRFNIRNSCFKNTEISQQNSQSKAFKRKHQKYFSCECSPHSNPFNVKKQLLQHRNQQSFIPKIREEKLKMKQKTQCFNALYIKRRRLCKQTINWVRYNIYVGIYALLGRIKTHFNHPLWQNQEYHQLKPQLKAINICLKQLQNLTQLMAVCPPENSTISHQLLLDKDTEKQKVFKVAAEYFKKRIPKQKTNSPAQTCKMDPQRLKSAIHSLNSAFCLLSRKISLARQNQLIKEFIEQTAVKSGRSRLPVQKIALLYEILQINSRRCSILNDLAQRITDINQFRLNFKMSEQQIQQLQSLNLLRDLEMAMESNKDEEISRISQTVQSILHPTHSNPNHKLVSFKTKTILKTIGVNNHSNREQARKAVRVASKSSKTCRASIQFLISQIQGEVCKGKRQPTKELIKSKAKVTIHQPLKTQLNLQLEIDASSKLHFHQPQPKKRSKQKKALAFATDLCEAEGNRTKSESKSGRSILVKKKLIKQAKEQRPELVLTSSGRFVSIKSLRSMKSLKSMRSITSNGSFGSNRAFARSLKTQHQMKFCKNRLKKISAIRPYRSKIFKLNEELANPNEIPDLLNFSTLQLEEEPTYSSSKILTSLNNLIREDTNPQPSAKPEPKQKQQVITHPLAINKTSLPRKANLIYALPENSKPTKPQHALFHRKSKKPVPVKEHNNDKSNAIRDFLSLCSEIKSGKQLIQNKKLFQQHFERLHQNKLIDECIYQKYKKYFNQDRRAKVGESRTDKLTIQEQEHEAKTSPYESLALLRRDIGQNKTLSQINKYYYNLDEFRHQQEAIDKTKQRALKDEEFFKIRLLVGQREASAYPRRRKASHFKSRYLSQESKLLQKEL